MNLYKPVADCVPWSDAELSTLRQLIGLEAPMTYIAQRLHRSPAAVRKKAQRVAIADMLRCPAVHRGLSLQPRR